ncbi:MAG: ABC transporter permease [Phycicoccus sp.]|nr:ABC transporter permease [Phycicoccus sp.]
MIRQAATKAASVTGPGRPRRGLVTFFKEEPLGFLAFVLISLFVILGVFAPWVAPHDPLLQDRAAFMQPPSSTYWFGTDALGRDILSRSIYGARTSLVVAVLTIVLGGFIGVVVGMVSGLFAGTWVDTVLQRLMDALMSIPALVLLLFVAALLGPSMRNTVIALSLLAIPSFNRVTRAEMLRIRAEAYFEAAHAVGASTWRLLTRYGLPNLMPALLVLSSLLFAIVLIAEASLSFLGIGTPPPAPSWGRMLSEGSRFLDTAPWIAIFPGLVLSVSVLAFNLLGDALRDFLDPRQRR